MAEEFIEARRQARLFAADFLAANQDKNLAIVEHGGIRLSLSRSGFEYVRPAGNEAMKAALVALVECYEAFDLVVGSNPGATKRAHLALEAARAAVAEVVVQS